MGVQPPPFTMHTATVYQCTFGFGAKMIFFRIKRAWRKEYTWKNTSSVGDDLEATPPFTLPPSSVRHQPAGENGKGSCCDQKSKMSFVLNSATTHNDSA